MDNYNKRTPTLSSLIGSICMRYENMTFNGHYSDALNFLHELDVVYRHLSSVYREKIEREAERVCRKMEHDSDLPF